MERTVERLLGVRVVERVDLGTSELTPVARLILDRSYDDDPETATRGLLAMGKHEVLTQVDRAYHDELDSPDDATYVRMMATGCVTWAIIRGFRLRLIASDDQDLAEALRRRTEISRP
ncbi:hypothetical protein [Kribbella swartbergensis]